MFTGIVEETGQLIAAHKDHGARRMQVRGNVLAGTNIGASIAINGACLSVVRCKNTTIEIVAIEETLRKTTLETLPVGSPVNLERAMQLQQRLDGHLVLGHVDCTAPIATVEKEGTARLYTIELAEIHLPYVTPTGSITIDGISLTVARLAGNHLTVAIIPHTFDQTACGTWQVGTRVNVEFDVVGKYVVRQQELSAHAH